MSNTFSSISVSKPKLSGIEAARGIAAALVVFYHAARHLKADYGVMPWASVFQFGHAGVDFFFVLSGFIIFFVHQQDLGRASRLPAYFERRFTRIYPLFWISLLVSVALTLMSSTQTFKGVVALLKDATLLPFGGDVGVAWTLQHEILFYLLFASAFLNRWIGFAVFSIWFVFIVVAWTGAVVLINYPIVDRLASTFNLEFFFGILAAYVVKNYFLRFRYLIFALGVVAFSGFAILENIGLFNGYAPSAQIAYGISSMLIVIGIASSNLKGKFEAPKLLSELGSASYAIYLLHLPCIGVIYKILGATGLLNRLPLGLLYGLLSAGAISICIIMSRLIEYPVINLVRTLISSHSRKKNASPQLTA